MKKPATLRAEAAQRSRNRMIEEKVLWLATFTKPGLRHSAIEAHLAPASKPSATSTYNHVVCIHIGEDCFPTLLSDIEMYAYFGHLARYDCGARPTREQKLARLAALASL